MSRTLHLFGTDWCAMMVPIQVIRWYRMQCYDGTDSCATVVPIRRYCHVSINTDDKGIFNTSLEREYALLAAAYSKDHTTKQEQSDLFEWLDSIRKMGLEQSFVPTNQ